MFTFAMRIFEMISTSTGSWIQSRFRRDWIQLPAEVEIIAKILMTITTKFVRTLDSNTFVDKPLLR